MNAFKSLLLCLSILILSKITIAQTTYRPSQFKSSGKVNFNKKIPSPVKLVLDIAFDGKDLWVAGWQESHLYKISLSDGKILKEIPLKDNATPRGLTFNGKNLFVLNSNKELVLELDTNDGKVLREFKSPCSSSKYSVAGLAWDGEFLWQTENFNSGTHYIYKMDREGTVLDSFPQISGASGLTYANGSLYRTDNSRDILFKVNLDTKRSTTNWETPGGDYPNGLAFDGKSLWLAEGDKDFIYSLNIPFEDKPEKPKLKNYDLVENFFHGDLVKDTTSAKVISSTNNKAPNTAKNLTKDERFFYGIGSDTAKQSPVIKICGTQKVTTSLTTTSKTPSSSNKSSLPKFEILVYPNPSSGNYNFHCEGITDNLSLVIYDGSGKVIRRYKSISPNQSVSITGQPSGYYFYKVFSSSKVLKTGKLLKN